MALLVTRQRRLSLAGPAHRMTLGVLLSMADTADLSFVIGSYITEVLTDSSQTRIFCSLNPC